MRWRPGSGRSVQAGSRWTSRATGASPGRTVGPASSFPPLAPYARSNGTPSELQANLTRARARNSSIGDNAPPMIVMKFGGTSVGVPEHFAVAVRLVREAAPRDPVVVVSTFSGVTNLIVEFCRASERRAELSQR